MAGRVEPAQVLDNLVNHGPGRAGACGDAGEAGSGEKMAVRLALSATEYHQQPVVQRFANALSEAGADLAAVIRDTLSGTLPVEDLDAISEQLESLSSPRVDLSTLAERIKGANPENAKGFWENEDVVEIERGADGVGHVLEDLVEHGVRHRAGAEGGQAFIDA